MDIPVIHGTVEAFAVRFEACERFRPGDEPLVCVCGWLEHDHGELAVARAARHRRARVIATPARRAS